MKKIILFASLVMLTTAISISQETEENYTISIGFNGGYGENFNAYRLSKDDNGFTYTKINPHHSFGLDFGLFLTKKMRVRLESRYFEMGYEMYWDDVYADFDKTITTLHNLEMNLHFDYSVFSRNRLQLYISPAIVGEFVMKDKFKTILTNGDTNNKNYNIFSKEYPDEILGGNIALLAKYTIIKHIGLTLVPEYTYFFQKFVSENNKPYQRIHLNLGVEVVF